LSWGDHCKVIGAYISLLSRWICNTNPMQQLNKQRAFELGQIVAPPGVLAALKKTGQQPGEFLTRHVNREWGDLSDEDRKENDYSLEHGFRLLSAYRTHAGDKLWIITESDRSVTIR
jgi:hypothetical protein